MLNYIRNFKQFVILLAVLPLFAFRGDGKDPEKDPETPELMEVEGTWTRNLVRNMTLDQKIGQLFMVAAYSNKGAAHEKEIERLITQYEIGGLIFMQGGPERQAILANRYQGASKIPLLFAQDSEWGLSMRLDSTMKFPRNMTLGAIWDDSLIYRYGQELGRQCRRVGVHVNFAPVVDVNNNPANPVINDRSFGEIRENVAKKGVMISQGMYAERVLACAKHFPGHGDTDTDSHLDLPVIRHDTLRLDSIELYPFYELIKAGVPSVMIAHLYIPALDATENQASTLSRKIVTDLLKEKMGFKGLIFTDALNMKGVAKYYDPGEVDVNALLAGNDVLLFPGDVGKAVEQIKAALKEGRLSEAELDESVMKILLSKEWAGLHKERLVNSKITPGELHPRSAELLRKELYESAITLAKNQDRILPLHGLEKRNIAHVQIGGKDKGPFYETLKKYAAINHYYLGKVSEAGRRKIVLSELDKFNTVVVSVDGMNKYSRKNFGISNSSLEFLKTLNAKGKDVIVTVFGNPYSLRNFGTEAAVLVAYENAPEAQVAAAEAIFGGLVPKGRLPVTASEQFPAGTGRTFRFPDRLAFGYPEEAGMDSQVLARIDSVGRHAVDQGATPGCAVLVMRGNKVVYDQGFGKTKYGKTGKRIDAYHNLYDLASVTKIMATTVSTMRLVQEGKINLDEKVSHYLPDLRQTNKEGIKVRKLLTHSAGLKSWIPFYMETISKENKNDLDTAFYRDTPDERFCVPIMDGLYMCIDYQDSIWGKIIDSKVKSESRVVYSDLGMIMMGRIIERVTGTSLDNYVDSVFYRPIGMNNTAFNPGLKNLGHRAVPTENDTYWRHKEVQGYVHDQASAMLGGVAGHAGLFSNIYDVAKLMFMLNNRGEYGGIKYFDQATIDMFTAKQLKHYRKGLGWDKPEMDTNRVSPTSRYCSEFTFGHTGFTGIGVWVDPKYDLVYIFLSNRTYPDANNKKLLRLNIRPAIQDIIYESIFAYENKDVNP